MNHKIKNINISHKIIGKNQPIFIIAEAGVNHNGQLKMAKKLVDIAVSAGADAVKFQTFKSGGVVTRNADMPEYAIKNIGINIKQIDMIKNYELKYEDFIVIKEYCNNKNIIFLSTPHSFDAIDFLENLVPAYKFGSGDITNIPALKHAAKKGKPIILGTGMSTLQEVKYAIDMIKSEGNNKIIVLHCTTNYPCSLDDVNLRAMITMQEKLDCFVGYSDHTIGKLVLIMAAANGAVMIEKHFTLNRNLAGPDHKVSLDPNELIEMIKSIRDVERARGDSIKKPTKNEEKLKKIARKSIVATINIQKGAIITKEMLAIKRPGTGLAPKFLEEIIGKRFKKDIKKDEILSWDKII